MIKEENYIVIQGFMISRLGLSGTDLLIYAIIYGFSQDGDSVFKGTRAYLAEWCNTSMSSVSRSLKELQKRGLIEQVHHSVDNKEVHYKANTVPSVNLTLGDMCQNDTRLGSKRHKASVKMTPVYKDNIADNIVDTKEEEEQHTTSSLNHARTREEVEDFIQEHCPHIDASGFWNYYEKRGWQIKGQPIEDWRAVAATWEEKMQQEMQAPITTEERVKLYAAYKRMFGASVPPEYLSDIKRIRLALATETPLGGNNNGTV